MALDKLSSYENRESTTTADNIQTIDQQAIDDLLVFIGEINLETKGFAKPIQYK